MRDPKGLDEVRQRLSLALPDLDAVDDPTNSHAPVRAAFVGCIRDNSGDVYEPQDHREWALQGPARIDDEFKVSQRGREAGQAIAAQLVARGWRGPSTLDKDAAIDLSKSFNGRQMHLGLQAFNDVVNVWVDMRFPRVCNSSS